MVLSVEPHGDVVELVLDRPDHYNAIDPELRDELLSALEDAERDGARCVLLRGNGRGFCGGMDLRAGGGHRGVDVTNMMRMSSGRLAERFLTSPVPIVSAVHGVCAGIGLTLAVGADHCVAATDARFVAAFLARSIVPDGGATRLLPRLVGAARARRMLLFGEEVSGAAAAEIGLIGEAVEGDTLLEVARGRAATLAGMPTQAISITKALLARSFELDLASTLLEERVGQGLISTSHDYGEGVEAFVDKRPARFNGR